MFIWLLILSIVVLALVYAFIVHPLKFWKNRNVACTIPAPIFGNYLRVFLCKDSYAEFTRRIYSTTAAEARYVGFYKFTSPILLIKDTDLIRKICNDSFDLIPKSLEDETRRTLRTAMSLPSMNIKLRAMFFTMQECAQKLLYSLENSGMIEAGEFFEKYADDVITGCIFGDFPWKCEDNFENGNRITSVVMKLLGFVRSTAHPLPADVFKQGTAANSDLIDLLMQARKCRWISEDGVAKLFPEEDVLSHALLSFISGFQTAAVLTTFLAYELSVNPYVQKKLAHEIEQTLRENDGKITYEALVGMKYLDMCVLEALRKWPPKPAIKKILSKPWAIDERSLCLPKGLTVLVPIYAIQRDPHLYPNPEYFDPERFADENKYGRNPWTFLGFGAGARNCAGSHIALLQIKVIMYSVLSHFEIVSVQKTPQDPIVLSKRHLDIRPEGGVWLGLKPKRSEVYY